MRAGVGNCAGLCLIFKYGDSRKKGNMPTWYQCKNGMK